jgi:hypothetical protein
MQRAPFVVGSMVAAGLIAGVVAVERDGEGEQLPELKVVFAQGNELPDTLAAGADYRAAFTVEWTGGVVGQRDGVLRVFASRQGDTSEDAPEGEWPLICESEFDDVVSVARLPCQFEAPGPGLLALQLEVRSTVDDKVIGEGIYTHNVVDPETMESNE